MDIKKKTYADYLDAVVKADLEEIREKDKAYGGSWLKRGGVGAYMMTCRKSDRIETQLSKPTHTVNQSRLGLPNIQLVQYDIIQQALADNRPESIRDDIGDLRRYLTLIEAEIMARDDAFPAFVVPDGILNGTEPLKPGEFRSVETGFGELDYTLIANRDYGVTLGEGTWGAQSVTGEEYVTLVAPSWPEFEALFRKYVLDNSKTPGAVLYWRIRPEYSPDDERDRVRCRVLVSSKPVEKPVRTVPRMTADNPRGYNSELDDPPNDTE